MATWIVLVLASSLLCCTVVAQNIINVSPDCIQEGDESFVSGFGELNCVDLDSALNELRDGMSLILESGTHIVRHAQRLYAQPIGRYSLSAITITGAGVNETAITCEEGHGLIFLGVRNLRLAGFTVRNCGMASEQLDSSFSQLRLNIDFFFLTMPPSSLSKIAMLIGNCANVMMEDVHITNTTGLGLLGINIVGWSMLNRVSFTRNIRPMCLDKIEPDLQNPDYFSQIGGGATFLYFDFINGSRDANRVFLGIADSYFAHNADCTSSAVTSVNFGFDRNSLHRYNYTLGAGGGLTLITASRNIRVASQILNCMFYQNDARYGAGVFMATFTEIQDLTFIVIENCTFLENGIATSNGIQDSYCQGGGGMAIFTGLSKLQDFARGTDAETETSVAIFVLESTFTGNLAAIQGGGVMLYSLFFSRRGFQVTLKFSNTDFIRNSAKYSSALHVEESASSSIVCIILQTVSIEDNYHELDEDHEHVDEDDAAVLFRDVTDCIFRGTVRFFDNIGTAFYLENTPCGVEPLSTLTFEQNIAIRGGAIHFSGLSFSIFLSNGSTLNFTGNQAVTEGGALYVAPLTARLATLQPGNVDASKCFVQSGSTNYSLIFSNNRAPLGSIFFGPSQENCSWAEDYVRKENFLHTLPASINASLRTASGQPVTSVVPGQTVDIDIEVIDDYDQTVPALVSSLVGIGNSDAVSTLGSSGFWHTSVNNSQITVTAANYSGPVDISIIAEQNSISTVFTVQVDPCPLGFSSDELSPRCSCQVNAPKVTCLAESVSFVTSEATWLGVEPPVSIRTTDDVIIHRCLLNYCKSLGTNNTVFPPDFDSQCDFNRSGLICGGCKEEFSHVFGSNECKKCSNLWLLLIPSFAIAGAALFSGIALLEITIDKGLTNVIIFLGSIVSQFEFLTPPNLVFTFLPIRLLALQLGVSTCFYDGMTALQRSALLFVFPIYLYVLMGIFTLLCRRFTWMSVHFSPAKTLATLTVMCYLSVLNTSLDILLPVRVESISGKASYRWLLDPTYKYFSGGHAALAVISIVVFLIYIVPLPLLFLFPPLTYRYLKKFTPFWDILWAAYKPKYRFWLGIRVLVIVASFPTAGFAFDYAILIQSSFNIIFLVCEASMYPFKDKWANYADLALLASFTMYVRRVQLLSIDQRVIFDPNVKIVSDVYLYTITLIIIIMYFLLFGLHILRQFPILRAKMYEIMQMTKQKSKPIGKSAPSEEHIMSSVPSRTSVRYHPPPMHEHPSNIRFRDSILEEINQNN